MTLVWKTRGRTGRDFKHLVVCAAFLGLLAKRKLYSPQGVVMCLCFIPLELFEGGICVLGKVGLGEQGTFANGKERNGGVSVIFWVFAGSPIVLGFGNSECASSKHG